MANETVKEMLKMINAKVEHIEDITADNRTVIIKLVKQSNEIVKFLKNLEVDIVEEYENQSPMSFDKLLDDNKSSEKLTDIKKLLDEFKSKNKDLTELEDELKKHKDKITPGQLGEA